MLPAGTRRILRLVLIAILLYFFFSSVSSSVSKYMLGDVATASAQSEVTAFRFPDVSVCGYVGADADDGVRGRPWIVGATHHLVVNGTVRDLTVLPTSEADSALLADPTLTPTLERRFNGFNQLQGAMYCDVYRPPEKALTPFGRRYMLRLSLDSTGMFAIAPQYFVSLAGRRSISSLERFGNSFLVVEANPNGPADPFAAGSNVSSSSSASPSSILTNMISVQFGSAARLNNDSRPCLEGAEMEDVNMERCFDEYVMSQVPCFGLGGHNSSGCSEEDGQRLQELFEHVMDVGESQFIAETGCKPPCKLDTFKPRLEFSARIPDLGLALVGKGGTKSDTVVWIYGPWAIFTATKDYESYDWNSLTGDIGGLAGLFLGASLLSTFDDAADAAGKAWDALERALNGDKNKKTSKEEDASRRSSRVSVLPW